MGKERSFEGLDDTFGTHRKDRARVFVLGGGGLEGAWLRQTPSSPSFRFFSLWTRFWLINSPRKLGSIQMVYPCNSPGFGGPNHAMTTMYFLEIDLIATGRRV